MTERLTNTIAIGYFAVADEIGETVIGDGRNELRLKRNGDVFYGGRLLTNDTEIVDGLRKAIETILGPNE